MEEWKEYRLGEIATFSQGIQVDIKSQFLQKEEGYIRFVRIVDYTKQGEEQPRYIQRPNDRYIVSETDLVMIRYGSQTAGKIVRGISGAIANNTFKVILNQNVALNNFVYYYLSQNSIREYFMRSQASSTMPAITFEMMGNLKVALPTLQTQQKIASILSSLDDKIEVNRRINEQLDELAQALFKSWLQKAKEKRTIGDMCNNILDYSKCSYDEVVLVNSSDVTRGIFEHHNYSPNNELKGHFKKRFRMYDVLYSEIRPRNQHYAYCLFDPDKYIASTRLMILRNKENIVSSSILYSYILLNSVQEEFTLKTETRSGTFPQGKFEDMAQITLPYHPIEQQTEMTDFLNAVYDKMWTNQQEITHLTTLRDTLLPKLMSGEIDVNEVEL